LHSESGIDFKENVCGLSKIVTNKHFVETNKMKHVQDIFMCFMLKFSFMKASTSLNFIWCSLNPLQAFHSAFNFQNIISWMFKYRLDNILKVNSSICNVRKIINLKNNTKISKFFYHFFFVQWAYWICLIDEMLTIIIT
jgi:hypothetical protein